MSNKYKILNSNVSANTHEFLVDEIADIRFLPAEPGSTAIVAENSDVYICNNTKQWVKFDSADGEETAFPSGKITITENGTDIDITQYATADVNIPTNNEGSLSKDSFKMQLGPWFTTSAPAVGDNFFRSGSAAISKIGLDSETFLISSATVSAQNFASGTYIVFSESTRDIYGYVCTFEFDSQTGNYIYKTVTPWDGTIDKISEMYAMGYYSSVFGFTVPDLNTFNEETYNPTVQSDITVLVLSKWDLR